MKLVKVRQAGNSLAVTIPRTYGLAVGDEVVVDRLPGGGIQILPATRLQELLRQHADELAKEDREALAILESHDADAGAHDPAHPAA